jgi:hypothetical protein
LCGSSANALQSCCSHQQFERPTLENIQIKLQQLHHSLANESCGGEDDAILLKALAEQHESSADCIDDPQQGSRHLHHKLPAIHQAVLRSDALSVQNIAKTRYSSFSTML